MARVVIVGPTASGKTDLAISLAREFGGEVVSADSRQVYRGLDAGTAKPDRDAQGLVDGIPYHLLDVVDPWETFDAGSFERLARPLCDEIDSRGRHSIVAGGTGLYVAALLDGLAPLPARDEAIRREMNAFADASGRGALHARLAKVDPEAARSIPANNIQRVIRALEVHKLTGRPISVHWKEWKAQKASASPSLILRIEIPAAALRERIERRAARMWPAILAEVGRLVPRRYNGSEPGFQSLGYPQALACLRGETSEEAGLKSLVLDTCAYAKRQRTWFRRYKDALEIQGGPAPEMLRQARALLPHYENLHNETTTA